jgi:hypothetical protein
MTTMNSVQNFILQDPTNSSRHLYVGQLFEWANQLEDVSLQAEVTTFASETKRLLLQSIQTPTIADIELLVREAGTVSTVRDM